MTAAAVNPLVRQADEKTKDIDSKIKDFFDKVNDVLSWVPGFLSHLIEPIKQGLDQLRQKLQEFWDRVNQLFEQPGNSDRLKEVGNQWVDGVGNPAGDIAGDIALTQLKANVEWTGRAAEAYKALVPAQGNGLNSIKLLANQIKSSLTSLANSIDSFWTAMTCALVGFAVAIVGAIVAACTVVGIPAAIGVIITAVGACLALITVAVTSLQSHVHTIEAEQATLKQKVHDLGTTWSKSSTEISDGSVSDGDPSDWRVNS
jgi:hypothetical protein